MNYLDLFHGIGGFALGAYWAGMKFDNHLCSDIEPYCQKLYKLRFPDSIQLGDITKIDTQELIKRYGTDWIITGGFPCQDISIAGKGAGITGSRSGLWFEYWRIIRDLRPRFAIMENVGAITFRGLTAVLGSLAEIGYNAEWQDIRASDMGAPHKRERMWILAYPVNYTDRSDRGQERETEGISGECRETGHAGTFSRTGSNAEDVADASIPRLEGQEPARGGPRESGLSAECGDELSNAERRSGRSGFVRGQGKPRYAIRHGRCGDDNGTGTEINAGGQWWSTEPDVGRLAHGVPHRVDRLRGLGNSIVPQIAELLFNQIKPYISPPSSE